MLKKVAFTMYPVTDLERAKAFYKKHFNLTPSQTSPFGPWVEYDLPEGGCFALTSMAEGVKPSANAGGTIAFEVDDLTGLVAKLKEDGVEIKLENLATPVCNLAVVLDSEGNSLMLHELKQKK